MARHGGSAGRGRALPGRARLGRARAGTSTSATSSSSGARASWIHFTKSLFSNWAADSAAQDYIIANVVLFPIWTIIDGRRRGIRVPWGFFVMSLFTSFAFAMAAYLAVVERQVRYDRAFPPAPEPRRQTRPVDRPPAAASSTA